jgi:hypothetical protein
MAQKQLVSSFTGITDNAVAQRRTQAWEAL